MTPVPALQSLARLASGEPQAALQHLLTVACELLGMDIAFVSVLDDAGSRPVLQSAYADGTPGPTRLADSLDPTWCARVAAEGPMLVEDARTEPGPLAMPSPASVPIVSYAGVPLSDADGTVFGTLCAVGHEVHGSLNARDRDVLVGLAEVVAPLVRALDAPPATPAVTGLAAVAAALDSALDLERLSRPLLDALRDLTGLASTYLTVVHEAEDVQEIRFARNTRDDFEIPEGLLVPWTDTLCKRAIDEDSPCTTDVPAVWGDSEAARSLGIQVYASVPVTTSNGQVWGTLCAADSLAADDVEGHLPTMRLFARLIGAEVEREEAVRRAREEADTDPLTGCASRRVVQPWLDAQLATLDPDQVVVVAFADLDRFKAVNDTLGHAAGDAVLVEVGHRLRAAARPHDLVARLGGDEFIVATRVPRGAAGSLAERVRHAVTFSLPWQAASIDVRGSVGVVVSQEHSGPSLVAAADAAMYEAKLVR